MVKKINQSAYANALRDSKLKVTDGRLCLLEALSNYPLSTLPKLEQIVAGTLDRSNVYRNVDTLVSAGLIKQGFSGFKAIFELGDTFQPHHHHFFCDNCEKHIELVGVADLEMMVHNLTNQMGLKATNHDLSVSGLCRDCK